MSRKKETPITTPIVIDPLDEFANSVSRIQDEIEKQFPEVLFKVLKKIAYEIGIVGLSESEACLISDYPHEKFIELKTQYPVVTKLVELKDLEYKRTLLKSISKSGGTDDKVAMWLLESRYPSEFNRRKGSGKGGDGEDPDDLIGMAIDFVRKSGDRNGLVTEESGKAFVVKGKGGRVLDLKSIEDVLA